MSLWERLQRGAWIAADSATTAERATHDQLSTVPEFTGEPALPLDTAFTLLQNKRRRHVLHYLASIEGETLFEDLVAYVVAQEYEQQRGVVDSADRKTVYVSLYQSHIPKLAEADIITYDGASSPIQKGRHFAELFTYLTTIEQIRH